jgi:hypothetical protein
MDRLRGANSADARTLIVSQETFDCLQHELRAGFDVLPGGAFET